MGRRNLTLRTVSAEMFTDVFAKAVSQGKTLQQIADLLDFSYSNTYQRARQYRAKGVKLGTPARKSAAKRLNVKRLNAIVAKYS